MFGDIEIEKQNLYSYESPIFLEDVNTYNILVSEKICFYGKNRNNLLVTSMMIIK